jgi:hypothetical protein
MEPATVTAIILGAVAIIGATIANMRVRSKCKNEALGLDISITKRFNEDLSRPETPPMRCTSSDDDETSL